MAPHPARILSCTIVIADDVALSAGATKHIVYRDHDIISLPTNRLCEKGGLIPTSRAVFVSRSITPRPPVTPSVEMVVMRFMYNAIL